MNTASRVTAAARPGTVLAAESVRDELGDDAGFSWSYAGARRLKGIKGESEAVPRPARRELTAASTVFAGSETALTTVVTL